MCDNQAIQPTGSHVEAGKIQGACSYVSWGSFDQEAHGSLVGSSLELFDTSAKLKKMIFVVYTSDK